MFSPAEWAALDEREAFVAAAVKRAADVTGMGEMTCTTYDVENVSGFADEVAAERVALIEQANSFVAISSYKLFTNCEEGRRIMEALYERCLSAETAGEPFTIRILMNQRAGVVGMVKPADKDGLKDQLDKLRRRFPRLTIELGYHEASERNSYHQKLWLADSDEGVRAMVCSGDIWAPSSMENNRREMSVTDTGELADGCLRVFNGLWHKHNADSADLFAAAPSDDEASETDEVKAEEPTGPLYHQGPALLMSKAESSARTDRAKASNLNNVALLAAIAKTEPGETISMIISNINSTQVLDALAEACNRGVNVRIFANKYQNYGMQKTLGGGANDDRMNYLVSQLTPQAHTNIDIRWATKDGERNKLVGIAEKYCGVHTKATMFSWGAACAGSSAIDEQADCSRELDVMYFGHSICEAMRERVFEHSFATGRDYFVDCAIGTRGIPSALKARLEAIDTTTSSQSQRAAAWRCISHHTPMTAMARAQVLAPLLHAHSPTTTTTRARAALPVATIMSTTLRPGITREAHFRGPSSPP